MEKMEKLKMYGRMGYVTRGIVYFIVGWLAVQAAFGGRGGSTTGAKGAILSILDEPFGQILIGLVAVGLVGYSIWRLLESLLDTDGHGTDVKGLIIRAGLFVSGVLHLGLAAFAVGLIIGRGGESGDGSMAYQGVSWLFSKEYGRWVVVGIGVAVFCGGLAQWYIAIKGKYKKYLEISQQKLRWISPICVFGLFSKGVVFLIIGIFFVIAAIQVSAGKIKDMQGALYIVQEQPFGNTLFGIVAAGLIAFAIYNFVLARYRRISSPTAIT